MAVESYETRWQIEGRLAFLTGARLHSPLCLIQVCRRTHNAAGHDELLLTDAFSAMANRALLLRLLEMSL